MSGRTAWVLADQISAANPALEDADRVLIVESVAGAGRLVFHRQKLHLVWSAMRHFARDLESSGMEVDYRRAPSLRDGLRGHIEDFDPDSIVLLEPLTIGAGAKLSALDPRVEVLDDGLFLTSPADFAEWASGRKQLRMEDFYRRQRRRFGLLMDGEEPLGGSWNFDSENRKGPPKDSPPPRPYRPREDEIDQQVRADLNELSNTVVMSGVDGPRVFPATRAEAQRALKSFCQQRLPDFGRYQDAMLGGERFMWHALISSSLNLGLLSPLECARAVEAEYTAGRAPINSVEGFIRQVIGWREYVWGVYRLRGEELAGENALDAHAPVPEAVTSLDPDATDMACLKDVLAGVRDTAYAHHIERLMVLGNLMLLLGVEPAAATDWFHGAFVDGYEWVMAPNVAGMALWADGGKMMSKPYAASGRYIDRMSDHCRGCRYSLDDRTSEDACPFTVLYWDFLDRNRELLAGNRRMWMPMKNLDRIDPVELESIRSRAAQIRAL
ncbi:MAG: cryptochrome/photolyase family protein [Solirubrobacterales bacterium]